MSKEDIQWLLYTPAHDVNFKQHLKNARLKDLKYVLERYRNMFHKKGAKQKVEAEIQRRKRVSRTGGETY